jgi:hypothetical protein
VDKPDPDLTPFVEINPYAAPEGPIGAEGIPGSMDLADAEALRRRYLNHEASVKAIGSLSLVGAVVLTVLSLVGFLAAAGVITDLGEGFRSVEADRLAMGLGGGVFFVLACLNYAVGIGLRRLLPWARWTEVGLSSLAILFSCLLLNPFNFFISLYILYLMGSAKGTMVFSPAYREVIAQTPHIKYRMSRIVKVLLAILAIVVGMGVTIAIVATFSGR